MSQARVVFFGLSAVYLLAVVVQFFLAGLGAFGATTYDAHEAVGYIVAGGALLLLVTSVVGRLPRRLFLVTLLLVAVNGVQIGLAQIDVEELAALHVVNALVVFIVAHALMQRSRGYLASKIAA
jgi:Family of unknown function (DUF6220)